MSDVTSSRPSVQRQTASSSGEPIWRKIKDSFYSSIGDIVFGMEDGTVSIFGLVFGVAASSTGSAPVLLAGATGAVAAAVSMMAGAFLDIESEQGMARAQLAAAKARISAQPEQELARTAPDRRRRDRGWGRGSPAGVWSYQARSSSNFPVAAYSADRCHDDSDRADSSCAPLPFAAGSRARGGSSERRK